jgi:hypothetical protein
VAARNSIIDYLEPRIESAISQREAMQQSDSVVAKLLEGLEEEGMDLSNDTDRCSSLALCASCASRALLGTRILAAAFRAGFWEGAFSACSRRCMLCYEPAQLGMRSA